MEYDPVKNEVKVVSKLPYPLRYASSVRWENKVILNKMFVFQYLKTVKVQGTVVFSKFNGIITDLPEISRGGGGVINFRTLEKRES